MNVKELRARHKDAQMRGQSILARAKTENRELTDEEEALLEKIKVDMDKYKKKLVCIEAFEIGDYKDKRKEEDGDDYKEDYKEEKSRRDEDEKQKDEDDEEKPPKEDPEKDEKRKGFRNLGDQMMAVYRASQPGAKIDTRLSTRSASGLNATNPSDGGFLVGPKPPVIPAVQRKVPPWGSDRKALLL